MTVGEPEPTKGGRELDRIIFFSDAVFAIAMWLPPSITLKNELEMANPPFSMSSAIWRLYLSSRIDPPSINCRSMSGWSCSFRISSWLRP